MLTIAEAWSTIGRKAAGRCSRCEVVYLWKPGKGRLVRDAVCPDCGKHLDRTSLGGMMHGDQSRRVVAEIEPAFDPCVRVSLALAKGTIWVEVDDCGAKAFVGRAHDGVKVGIPGGPDDRAETERYLAEYPGPLSW